MKKVTFRTPEEFHNKLSLIFNTSIALPLLPFVWLFLEIKNREFKGVIDGGILTTLISYGIPLISGLIVLRGFKLVEIQRKKATQLEGLSDKLSLYYEGLSKWYMLVGVASALMAFGLWLTTSGVIIIAYVILLFTMSLYRPTPRRYIKDLGLTSEHKDIVLNKKSHEL